MNQAPRTATGDHHDHIAAMEMGSGSVLLIIVMRQ